jgi:membrane-bound metal-dependent hydrolase YbcI (DUF457 family)
MMGPTHALIGGSSAFVATTAAGLPFEYVIPASVLAFASSSLPDLDQKWPLKRLVRHRTVTHYPALQLIFFAAVVAIVAVLAPDMAVMAAALAAPMLFACVMHSVADAMTIDKQGIQLLWPISRRGYHLLPWKMRIWVGSKLRSEPLSWRFWRGWKLRSEQVFVAIWVGFVLIYAYARFSSSISA